MNERDNRGIEGTTQEIRISGFSFSHQRDTARQMIPARVTFEIVADLPVDDEVYAAVFFAMMRREILRGGIAAQAHHEAHEAVFPGATQATREGR